MPRGDGNGPLSAGVQGQGQGQGRGRMGGSEMGGGEGIICACPRCGRTYPHRRGEPCNQVRCPYCGVYMSRLR